MPISEATKRTLAYQEAFGLMEAKKITAIKEWKKQQEKFAQKNYQPYVSSAMFNAYLAALEQYKTELETAYSAYHASSAGAAKKENLLADLIFRKRTALTNCINSMNKRREEHNKTAVSQPTPNSSKGKSGAWAKVLGSLGLATALLGGAFWWGKSSSQNSGSREGDRAQQGITQDFNSGVAQNGNTWSQSPTDSLKDRLQQAQLLRRIKEEEDRADRLEHAKRMRQLEENRNAAYTRKYLQEKNQEIVQGDAYASWYIQEKRQQAVRSNERTAREISGTQRQIRRDRWH